ncbi:MAG TPA: tryptophan 7-halogenase, partial [Povalibacter sp.]|nr:tryptophan 7-halogenase [Povalibacter sp.]
IPLQHRVGNGLVYCSRYMSDDEATARLVQEAEGKTLTQPRVIRFKVGRRQRAWNKNVLALGLASGFLEPLESTSIHLVITGIARLMQLFPFNQITQSFIDQYNDDARREIEHIRDFIVLHYKATDRRDSPFWEYCANMEIPESLARRIEMFRERAYAYQGDSELFRIDSWVQVMLGQGIKPTAYHQLTQAMSKAELVQLLTAVKTPIAQTLERLPTHQQFIDHYCKAAM